MILFFIWVWHIISSSSNTSSDTPQSSPTSSEKTKRVEDLHANISYNNSALKIDNLEEVDWINCKFELNDNYKFKYSDGIKTKDSLIIPFTELTDKDNNRFNIYQTKLKDMFISCDSGNDTGRSNYFIFD